MFYLYHLILIFTSSLDCSYCPHFTDEARRGEVSLSARFIKGQTCRLAWK